MNFTSLLSIFESKNNLSDELFKKYLEYLNVNLEDNETEDLLKLIEKLLGEYQNSNIFDGYYIGYKIPQISKEFDLLRVTKNSIINIELKSGSGEESIKKQLTHEHERYPFQLESVEGVCIAIAHRRDNDDDKLIVVPAGTEFTDEQIMAAIHFQEQWFDTVIVR